VVSSSSPLLTPLAKNRTRLWYVVGHIFGDLAESREQQPFPAHFILGVALQPTFSRRSPRGHTKRVIPHSSYVVGRLRFRTIIGTSQQQSVSRLVQQTVHYEYKPQSSLQFPKEFFA
jgi:hypothetical protein